MIGAIDGAARSVGLYTYIFDRDVVGREAETAVSDVTQILAAIQGGDTSVATHLLPLVYDELCKLAAQRLASEKPGQTLQATALVHDR